MKAFILSFDLEEFNLPFGMDIGVGDEELFEISRRGLKNIMSLLNKTDIVATFFVTLKFAKTYPDEIKLLIRDGHEIGIHGYEHSHGYGSMPEEKAREYIIAAKERIEELFNITILGFRAPRFNRPQYSVLRDAEMVYDSSIHPTFFSRRWTMVFNGRAPSTSCGVAVVPVSVTPLIRLPFSWIWFRNFGLQYATACTKLCMLDQDYVSVYFHPWEFADLCNYDMPESFRRNTGDKLVEMMGKYIRWCKQSMEFKTMGDYVTQFKK